MKKIISFLGSISLITTTAISVVGCQKSSNENSNPIFPFPPEKLTETNQVQKLIGKYFDFSRDSMGLYWEIELPKGIKTIDSTNWQNSRITLFIATSCFEFIGYQLGQRGGFHFETDGKHNYSGSETNKDYLTEWYENFFKEEDLTNQSKEELTRWYNWTLREYS